LKSESREREKYKLDLLGVQVRWDKRSTEPADEHKLLYGNGDVIHQLRTGFFVHKGIISAVKRAEFVSARTKDGGSMFL
jgi:hypothetical protein